MRAGTEALDFGVSFLASISDRYMMYLTGHSLNGRPSVPNFNINDNNNNQTGYPALKS